MENNVYKLSLRKQNLASGMTACNSKRNYRALSGILLRAI